MLHFYIILAIYITLISLIAIVVTLKDKSSAKKGKWRVKESTLLIVSALGGSVAMLLTMRQIRHKTKHLKFMLGIPVIIVLQLALIATLIYLGFKQTGGFGFLLP